MKTKTTPYDWATTQWARACEEAKLVAPAQVEPTLDAETDDRGALVDPLSYLASRAANVLKALGVSSRRQQERAFVVWLVAACFVIALGALVFPLARVDRLLDGGVNLAGPFVFFILGQIFFLTCAIVILAALGIQEVKRRILKRERERTFGEKTLEALSSVVGSIVLVGLRRFAPKFYGALGRKNAWLRRRAAKESDDRADGKDASRKCMAIFWDTIFSKPRAIFFWGGFLSHLFWTSCSVCMLVILGARMQGNQYDYCWRTSLEDEAAVKRAVDFLGAPMSMIGVTTPDETDVAMLFQKNGLAGEPSNVKATTPVKRTASYAKQGKTAANARKRWSFFLLGIVFFWCVVPRAALACVYHFMFKRALRDYLPNLEEPYFVKLIVEAESYQTTTASTVVDDPIELDALCSENPDVEPSSDRSNNDSATCAATSQAQVEDSQPAEPSPDDEQPVETQTVEERPVEDIPAEKQPIDAQSVDVHVVEAQSIDAQTVETQSVETQSVETQSVETQSVETQPLETQPVDVETVEAQSIDAEAVNAQFVESPSVEVQLVEELPKDVQKVERRPVESKPSEARPVETPPVEVQPVVPPLVEPKPLPAPPKPSLTLAFGYDASLPADRWQALLPLAPEPEIYGDAAGDFAIKKKLKARLEEIGSQISLCAFITDAGLSPARHFVKFMRDAIPCMPNAKIYAILTGGERLRVKYGAQTNAVAERLEDWTNALNALGHAANVTLYPVFYYDAALDLPEQRARLRDLLRGGGDPNEKSDRKPRDYAKWDAASRRVLAECRAIFAAVEFATDEETERRRAAQVCAELFEIYREETDRATAAGVALLTEKLGPGSILDKARAAADAAKTSFSGVLSSGGPSVTDAIVERCKESGLGKEFVEKRLQSALGLSEKMRGFCAKLSPKCAVATASVGLAIPALVAFAPLLGGAATATAVASAFGALGTLLPTSLASGAAAGAIGAVAPMSLSACKKKISEKLGSLFRMRAAENASENGEEESGGAEKSPEQAVANVELEIAKAESAAALACVTTTWRVVLELQGRPEDEIVELTPQILAPLEESNLDSLDAIEQAFADARALLPHER